MCGSFSDLSCPFCPSDFVCSSNDSFRTVYPVMGKLRNREVRSFHQSLCEGWKIMFPNYSCSTLSSKLSTLPQLEKRLFRKAQPGREKIPALARLAFHGDSRAGPHPASMWDCLVPFLQTVFPVWADHSYFLALSQYPVLRIHPTEYWTCLYVMRVTEGCTDLWAQLLPPHAVPFYKLA